jgi:hypothetical protein
MIRRVFSYKSAPESEFHDAFQVLLSFSKKGFIFLKFSDQKKKILSIDEFQFDYPIRDLNGLLGEFKAFTSDFLSGSDQAPHIMACLNADSYTLVPEELFEPARISEYCSFAGINPSDTDYLSVEDITAGDSPAKLIIFPTAWQIQFVKETFPMSSFFFDIKQFSTNVLRRNDNPKAAYIHVSESHYDLILTEETKPLLFNRFNFSTAKEFCYYIIGSLNSLGIDPYTTPLFVSGDILPGSEIISLVNKYVQNILWLAPADIAIPENLPVHRYFIQLSAR